MHQMVLMRDRIHTLEEANRTISKRRRAKRTFIQDGGILHLEPARDILTSKDVDGQLTQEIRANGAGGRRAKSTLRRCSKCNQTGHNVRTCPADEETPNVHRPR